MNKDVHRIAECVGLWLAEGDKKTQAELTFTNNCLELVLFFKEIISEIYEGKNQPRLYIYSPSTRQLFTKMDGFKKINFYIDKRANRPYYIYRLADSIFLKIWKKIVEDIVGNEDYYADILRGIFAGEGNVKHSLIHNNSKQLRISAKTMNALIEKLLDYFSIKYDFNNEHRLYCLRINPIGRFNLLRLTELHPEKEARFIRMIDSIKEIHYSPGQLEGMIWENLIQGAKTNKELSEKLKRSSLRIMEVLQKLKNEKKIGCIKLKRGYYWDVLPNIEKYKDGEKIKVLNSLHLSSFAKIGRNLNMNRKSVSRKIKIYEKEKLLEKSDGWWKLTTEGKQFIAGIDEAGR